MIRIYWEVADRIAVWLDVLLARWRKSDPL
jgi:hypothetical protein